MEDVRRILQPVAGATAKNPAQQIPQKNDAITIKSFLFKLATIRIKAQK
jgi:hypothetical protein